MKKKQERKWEISEGEFIAVILFYGFIFLIASLNPKLAGGYILGTTLATIFFMFLNRYQIK